MIFIRFKIVNYILAAIMKVWYTIKHLFNNIFHIAVNFFSNQVPTLKIVIELYYKTRYIYIYILNPILSNLQFKSDKKIKLI
jgi:hypothetical protein